MRKFFQVLSNISGSPWGHVEATGAICSNCRRQIGRPLEPIKVFLPKARKRWPEAFGIDNFSSVVFHKTIVDALVAKGQMQYVRALRVKISFENGDSCGLCPEFFYLDSQPGIDFDYSSSCLEFNIPCEVCDLRKIKEFPASYDPSQHPPIQSTWNGSWLFRERLSASADLFCSEEFVNLVNENKWKTFFFRPLNAN